MRQLSLLLFTGLVLMACEKEPNLKTSVSGRVVTFNTMDFPSDTALPVELGQTTGGSGLGVGEKVRQTTYTDEKGNFSFRFTAGEEWHSYFIRVPHEHTPPLHYDMSTAGGRPVEIGKEQVINIELRPFAWLKLHVRNVNPQPGDIIRISLGGGELLEYFGDVDKIHTSRLSGNVDNFNFPFSVKRGEEMVLHRDTVENLPAFDTTYHLLEY